MFDFLKRLFKKKEIIEPAEAFTPEPIEEDEPTPEPESPLNHIWSKLSDGQYDEVITETKSIIESEDNPNQNEALKLLSLAYFRQGKYGLAEEASIRQSRDSGNSDDWFNLVTTATMNGNIELSETAYSKTIELYNKNGTRENLPMPQVFYYYMQALRDIKAYDKAFAQLERLKDLYCNLAITDPTFLYLRGVPFLEHTMEAGKEILENIDKDTTQKLLAEMHSRLDDEGKQYIDGFEQTITYKS